MPTQGANVPRAGDFTAPGLRVLREDANYHVAAHENLLVIHWRRTPEAEAWYTAYDLGVELARTSGAQKISVTSVLAPMPPASPPVPGLSASARSALVDLHERSQAAVHRTAVVLPDTGFIAAVARSIFLSITPRTARRDGHGVFYSLASAMAWATDGLETTSGRPVPVIALAEHLARVR